MQSHYKNLTATQEAEQAWTTLEQAEGVFFDLDGCVYFGERIAEGAGELLQALRGQGKRVRFVTNNSTDSGEQVAARLARMGLEAQPEHIMTATELVGVHLFRQAGPLKLKAVGSQSLHAALERAGHRVLPLDSKQRVDMVVFGRDTTFSYAKLAAVLEEAERGTPVLGTNLDLHHPGVKGRVPETGALYAPVELILGRKLEAFGKPAPHMFRLTMEQCGIARPDLCVMVGDNLYTDVAGGRAAGMRTFWLYGPSLASSSGLPAAADPAASPASAPASTALIAAPAAAIPATTASTASVSAATGIPSAPTAAPAIPRDAVLPDHAVRDLMALASTIGAAGTSGM
ncbi:HAD-IIA family hydrolase [Paenibacillus koleovorans]|uniref:HAD-IIA family hydrolase n=1 Tax=Paenibacillus koleovorans TaxID=121608 RepID=UPI0013E3C288|nr:HAD-IIA family hydrolase [Paenibacillus koleovorans]